MATGKPRVFRDVYVFLSLCIFSIAGVIAYVTISISVPLFSLYHQFWPEKNVALSQRVGENIRHAFTLVKVASKFSTMPELIESILKNERELTAMAYNLPQVLGLNKEKIYIVCASVTSGSDRFEFQRKLIVSKGLVKESKDLSVPTTNFQLECLHIWKTMKIGTREPLQPEIITSSQGSHDGFIFLTDTFMVKLCKLSIQSGEMCANKKYLINSGGEIIIANTKRESLKPSLFKFVLDEISKGNVKLWLKEGQSNKLIAESGLGKRG